MSGAGGTCPIAYLLAFGPVPAYKPVKFSDRFERVGPRGPALFYCPGLEWPGC